MLLSRAANLLFGYGATVKRQDSPRAVSVSPSGWFGNDGNWSTFEIQVGSPPQPFNVLVSTSISEVTVPLGSACDSESDPNNCGRLRGAEEGSSGFNTTNSTSWTGRGIDGFNSSTYNLRALYGYDTVQFLDTSLEGSLIAAVGDADRWLGYIGLNPEAEEVGGRTASAPLQALKDKGVIPSLSFGYTAGAAYGGPSGQGVPGSLTLGGYDNALMSKSNQLTSPISNGSFLVSVDTIEATDALNGTDGRLLLSNYQLIMSIDPTVSELWLPEMVCERFAESFGLVYQDNASRYAFNDEIHDELLAKDPMVHFNLTDSSSARENSTRISIPYSAFDQYARYPIFANDARYFPIRRASENQYKIGRVFLQEAYLMGNLEAGSYTLAKTVFSSPPPAQEIVTIAASGQTTNQPPTNNTESSGSGLSGGAIAGIVIGVLAVLAILGIVAFLIWKRRKSSHPDTPELDGGEQVHEKPSRFGSLTAWQKNRASRRRPSGDVAHELAGDNPTPAIGYHADISGGQPSVMRKDTHELDAGHVRRDESTVNRVEA